MLTPDHYAAIAVAISAHKGIITGAGLGLAVAGFWGLVIGTATGFAYDQWERFVQKLKITPRQALPVLPPDSALVLALAAYARALDLPQLRAPTRVLAVLKAHFSMTHETLRYAGKIIQPHETGEPEFVAAQQALVQACAASPAAGAKVLTALRDIASNPSGGMDPVSHQALAQLAARVGMAETWNGLTHGMAVEKADDDPYEVLAVSPSSSADEISRRYRALIQQAHPDRVATVLNPFTRERMQARAARLNAAYERLKRSRV